MTHINRRDAGNDPQGLEPNRANHAPLTPLDFLARTAQVFPDRPAVIHGDQRISWDEAAERCRRLASALRRRGVRPGDCVAVMAPNTPPMFEAHHGVPLAGAMLNALNVRLDADTIAFILNHGEAKVLITDRAFADTISRALETLGRDILVIDIDDPQAEAAGETLGPRLGETDYESFLREGDPAEPGRQPDDEWEAISLNYTSGTTGNPKGVVYHHRGAYLNALGNVVTWNMAHHPIYLWTLPMFHCNGWCFPWTVTALAGTHVCLRRIDAAAIYRAIADHGVTHLCGAPIIMQMILGAGPEDRAPFEQQVQMMTAAAPPPAPVLAQMAAAGFKVTHVYGLTETYGPAVVCAWNPDWNKLEPEAQAAFKARQGVKYAVLEDLMVGDPETLEPVPQDGATMGEVFMRGNIVMKGYLKNPKATAQAFDGGWFHSGDLGVRHPDGYLELKDRSKDIIISGGENISSIEVEGVLYRHPAVAAVAVVAAPHDKWGETPCAFVEVRPGHEPSEDDLIAHCRAHMAHFKCPTRVVFGELPKTSTGKIQKFILRERASAR
jgi:3-(methylthio)propionyl---CoA ligase